MITSTANAQVKNLAQLIKKSKVRTEQGVYIVEGVKMFQEAPKEEIVKILEVEGVDKVNIIAHSKGGLDSKYMIENLGMEDSVASLTTLCTPHKGSPIATNILKLPKFLTKFIAFWINFWYKLFGDKNPDSYQACQDLKRINSIEEEIINSIVKRDGSALTPEERTKWREFFKTNYGFDPEN